MLKYLCMSITIGLLLLTLSACSNGNIVTTPSVTEAATSSSSTSSPTPMPTTTGGGALHISNVSVSINPTTLVSISCGSTTDITFTATLYANVGSGGGQVAYTWTINGANTPGMITFGENETSKTVIYTLSAVSIQYNAVNIPVTFSVNSPNQITSAPARVAGNCTFPNPLAVTGISLTTSLASLTGLACGTSATVTYTATITIGANSVGGQVVLLWQFPRFKHETKVLFSPGTTTQTAVYVITQPLKRNAPFPGGSLASTTPNVVSSNTAGPGGTCM